MRSVVEGFLRVSVYQARQLRKRLSPPEAVLWRTLRTRPAGLLFRRQHPAGPYIFDFFCRSAALAIEVDGFAHECGDNPARDQRRDAWARSNNIATLRFAARDVQHNLEAVVTKIVDECFKRTPPPASPVPLPAKMRGGTSK